MKELTDTAAKLLESIRAFSVGDKQSNGKCSVTERIYTDEPIIRPQQSEAAPGEYRRMRAMALLPSMRSAAMLFYHQGKLMENFEDDYRENTEFFRYYPTYADMTLPQLRSYFTWRTRVRRGERPYSGLSYAFVYIYELLNLIGAESPQQAYARLKEFAAWYAGFDDRIERYAKIWLSDLAVYYGMDVSLVDKGEQADFERSVQLLTESAKHPASEIFPVLNALSSYDLTHSKLYRLYPEETEATAVRAFNLLSDYYGKHRRSGICERFFGKVYESPYVMFRSAVFYREEKHPDTEYTVDPLNVYICRSGNWINRRLFASKGRNRLLGEFIKSVDAVLRKCLSVTPELKCQPSKLYTELITKAWQNVCGSRQKAAAANISIDTSALAGIRQNADDTLKCLLDGLDETEEAYAADTPVEADKGAYPAPDTQAPGNTAAQGVSSRKISLPADSGESNIPAADRKAAQPAPCDSEAPAETGLTELEKEYLRRVLCAEPFSELLRSESVLPSVIMDSVNEKLFDTFSDTVLIGEETAPEAVEDYTAQLYELLGLNTSEGRKA